MLEQSASEFLSYIEAVVGIDEGAAVGGLVGGGVSLTLGVAVGDIVGGSVGYT